ncbi:MAG: L,D-transpeptidase family protein [Bdellovibrionota bacterium]
MRRDGGRSFRVFGVGIFFTLVSVLLISGCIGRRCDKALRVQVQKHLQSLKGEPAAWRAMVAEAYAANSDCPIWCEGKALIDTANQALKEIETAAPRHGLNPELYHLKKSQTVCSGADSIAAQVDADLLVSDSITRFIADLHGGVLRRVKEIEGIPIADRAELIPKEEVRNAFSDRDPLPLFKVDGFYDYTRLQEKYLKSRVQNPAEAEAIAANMERNRWMGPAKSDTTHVLVDIARFQAFGVREGKVALAQKIIVGKEGAASPMLADEVTTVILNPRWVIPYSIASKEILPKLQSGTDFLKEKNYEIYSAEKKDLPLTEEEIAKIDWSEYSEEKFPFRIEQKPGESNPLGKYEILFPNSQAVYLHDSPARSLFETKERMFSHGCIRLEKPRDLVNFVLEVAGTEESWSQERIDSVLKDQKRTLIKLRQPIPIYLMYRTVWLTEDNKIANAKDVYGWDEKIVSTMKELGAWNGNDS